MFYVLGCKQSMDEKCLKNYLLMVLNKKKRIKVWWKVYKNYNEDSDKGYTFEVDVE